VVRRRVDSLLAPYGNARTEHGSGLGKTRYVDLHLYHDVAEVFFG